MSELPFSCGKTTSYGCSSCPKTSAKCPKFSKFVTVKLDWIHWKDSKHGKFIGTKAGVPKAVKKYPTIDL